MLKLKEGELTCPELRQAEYEASSLAMDQISAFPDGYQYTEKYGNFVGNKGTGLCTVECPFEICDKRVKVTLTAPKIEGLENREGEAIVGYDLLNAQETLQVSGHKCATDSQKR